MPLPLLAIPIAITVGSAAAQMVGKLKSRKELNDLRTRLADAKQRHRHLLTEYYLRQHYLCRQLGLEAPELPLSLLPPEPEEDAVERTRQPRWKRLIRRKEKTTLTQGATESARVIIGRHSFSAVSGVVWKTTSASILRVVQPVGLRVIQPVGARIVPYAPRLLMFGGGASSTGGSIAASTAARATLAGISGVGLLLGPAIAAWTVTSEIRKIKKARRDLRILLANQDMELAGFRVRNRRLESWYAEQSKDQVEQKELAAISG